MNSTAASLVRRINQFLGGGQPQWNGSSRRLAIEYTELIERLCQRFSLAQLQIDLEDYEEARSALHQPEPLLVEIRGLQFARRLEWEKLVRTHVGPFRKLVSLDEVLRLEQQLQAKGQARPSGWNRQMTRDLASGTAKNLSSLAKEPEKTARQLASEAGFADARSPASIRMIPFVVAILAVGLALFLIAVVGPGFLSKRAKEEDAGMGAGELANLPDKPDPQKNNPGEVAFAERKKANDPGGRAANRPAINPEENAGAAKNERPIANDAENQKDKKDKKGQIDPDQMAADDIANALKEIKEKNEKKESKENKENKAQLANNQKNAGKPPEAPLPAGMIRGPEIVMLDQMISEYAQADSGLKLKKWLRLDNDMADKAAVDGLLDFIRADSGLAGRKPLLEWKDLPEWIESGRSLNKDAMQLFHPEKLKSMVKSGNQAEADLVEWFNKMIVADLKPLRFFSSQPRVIYPEALFSFAANVDLVEEFSKFIDRKMIEYEQGRPKKVKPYISVILKEKRDLKNLSNDDLLTSLIAINTELKRRIRTAHYPWKTSPP